MELGKSSKPCTEETEAEDGTRTLDVLAAANQTKIMNVTEPEVEVPYGESTEQPMISAKIMLQWARMVQIYAEW